MPTLGGNLRRLREAQRVTKALVERAIAAGVSEEKTDRWLRGRHLTQGALGQIIGVSQPTVGRWEKDEVLPDDDTLERICEWLECSREELLPDSDPGASEAQIQKKGQVLPELSDIIRTIGVILPELSISDPQQFMDTLAHLPGIYQELVEQYVYFLDRFIREQAGESLRTFPDTPLHIDTRVVGKPPTERKRKAANDDTK